MTDKDHMVENNCILYMTDKDHMVEKNCIHNRQGTSGGKRNTSLTW